MNGSSKEAPPHRFQFPKEVGQRKDAAASAMDTRVTASMGFGSALGFFYYSHLASGTKRAAFRKRKAMNRRDTI